VAVIWREYPGLQWQQIDPGIFGLVANVIAMVTVSLATKPMDEEHVRQFVVE
jgi:Na+(H+)/acetate symporter ActP